MGQVSAKSIEKAVQKIDSLSEEELDKVIESFATAQQDLVNYILQAGLEYENENYEPMQELISQFNLQEFMVAEIEAKDEDGEELSEETKTQLFIVSTAIIGLLNEASSK